MSEERAEVTVERVVAGGDGLGHLPDGRVVFVPGAMVDEVVAVEVVDARRDFARGSVAAVVRPSPHRIEPTCRHRLEGCGGCDWRHVEPVVQLPTKLEVVREAFARTAGLPDVDLRPGGSVDADGYRTTVRVAGGVDGRAGFRASRSDAVVATPECLVAAPPLRELVAAIELDRGVEATLRVSLATGGATARWRGAADAVRGLPDHVATGPDAHVVEHVAGRALRVSAGSFFQSGPQAAELLVATVRAVAPELGEARHVVDAYAGVGLFASTAASDAERVTAVESSRPAVADARVNLDRDVATVVRSDVDRWRPSRDEPPVDVVVADPARRGLRRGGVEALVATGAPVLVLVSCDPVAAARDTALLAAAGYVHDGAVVVDLFPWTHHVEVIGRFVRRGTS